MKICFLADGNHTNCQSWLNYLASELGHEVHLISLENVEHELGKVRVHVLDGADRFGKLKYLLCVSKVKKLIKTIEPDIVIGYRVSSYGFLAACTGFHPLVVVAQGYNIDNPEKSRIKNLFIKYAIRKSDLCHAWGNHMGERFVELGADPSRVKVFPRGINTELFDFKSYPQGMFSVIMTRGLKSGYDLELPFKAVAELIRRKIQVRFLVAGDGPIRGLLETLANEVGISAHVKFLGHVINSELPYLLSSAHAYVSPVPTDGVSASLLEAMACGLIPVVIDNPANRLWLKDGENGFLVKAGDYSGIADALEQIANNRIPVDQIRQFNRGLVLEKGSLKENMIRMERELLSIINSFGLF